MNPPHDFACTAVTSREDARKMQHESNSQLTGYKG